MDNVEKKAFTIVGDNGYDADEVNRYIADLEAKLVEAQVKTPSDNDTLTEDFLKEFESMKLELASYREIETKLKEALRAAHKATENIQRIVENESRRILYEANKNADEIIIDALEQSMLALKYIKKMRTDARVFQKRFEVFVAAQNQFIDHTIWNEILAPINAYEFIDIHSIDDIKKITGNEEKE